MVKTKAFLILVLVGLSCAAQDIKRLIKTSEDEPAVWMSSDEVWALIKQQGEFVDVTGHTLPNTFEREFRIKSNKAIPSELRYQETVLPLFNGIVKSRLEQFLHDFTAFSSRYYNNSNGLQSATWLYGAVQDAITPYNGESSISYFNHSWMQPSIIARIEGSDEHLRNQTVIVGGHQDSINRDGGSLPAPGVDDNACGSSVVLEILRVLVNAQFRPRRSIEFQFYAAEEVGLLGSGEIAKKYFEEGKDVVAMINIDVPGYFGPESENFFRIVTDMTDPALAQLLRLTAWEYTNRDVRNSTCGYGCSDHVSWHNYGFSSSFPLPTPANPNMHTLQDTFDKIDLDQVVQFTRLALSAAVEIAEPLSAF